MVDLLEQLFPVIWQEEIAPGNGERALLLIYIFKRGIGWILVTTGVLL